MDMKKTFLARLTAFIAAATMAVSPVGIDMMSLAVSAEETEVTVSANGTQDGEEPDSDGQESEGSEQKAATQSKSDGGQADIEQHDAENSDAVDAAEEFTVTFDDTVISVYSDDVGNLKNGDTIASGSSVLIGTELDDYVNHRVKVNGEALELTSNGDIYYMNKGYTVTEDTVIEYVEDNWSEEELSKYAVLEVGNNISVYPYGDDPEFGTWTVNHLLSTGNYYPKGSKLAIKVDKYFLEGEKYLSINGEKAEGTVNKDGVFEVIGYTVEDDNVKIAIEGLESYTVSFDDPNIMVSSDTDDILNGDVVEENTCIYIGTKLDNYIDHRLKINGKAVELTPNGDVYYYYTSMYIKENISIELAEAKWSADELSKYAVLNVDDNVQVYPYNEYYESAVTYYPLSTGNHYPKGKKLVIRVAKDALGESEYISINGEKAEAYLNDDDEYQVWGYAVETDTVNINIESEADTCKVSIKNPELNIYCNGELLKDGAKVEKGAEIYIGTVVDNYIDHRIKVNGEKLDVYPNGDGYVMGNSYTVNGNITVELADEKWSEAELSDYVVFDIGENINVYPYNPSFNSTDLTHPYATGNYLPKGQSVVIRIANELLGDGKCLLINGSLASGSVNADGEFQVWGYPVNCKENTLTIAVGMAGVSLKNSTTGTSDNFDTLEAAMTYINKNGKANYNYEIVLGHNVEIKKLTLPAASKAASLKILGNGNTVTIGNPSLSVPMNIVLNNVKLESKNANGYTLTASKNIEMYGFESETLTSLKGSTRSKLIINGAADLTYQVAGFGTAVITGESSEYYLDVEKPFTVNDLELNSGWLIVRAGIKVTVKNIKSENDSVLMYDDGFTPITINGNVSGKLSVSKCENERFENGQLLIVSKTADTSAFDVTASAPDDGYEYVLSRKASNLYIKKVVLNVREFTPYSYDTALDEYSFAEWSDLINTINSKKQANVEYFVMLTDNYDTNGSLTMPKAGTYARIVLGSNDQNNIRTLTFTGNVTMTGNVYFPNIKLNSVKKVNKIDTPTKFKIAAGKYKLEALNVEAPMLTDITGTNTVWVNNCDLNANVSAQNVLLLDSKIGGNVTAKNTLSVYGEVSVGKNISALTVASYEDGAKLSVVKGQKFTIGKGGVHTENESITLTVLDANGKVYSVPAMGAIATIAGNYAGDFKLSDDCGGDKLTVVKSGRNLVAAGTDKLIYMTDEDEKTYAYATLADAMNDITAIGNTDGTYTINVTDEAVLAKLPAAKKYKEIIFNGGGKLKTASDLTLTGNLKLLDITVTKYNAKTKAEDLPINVNVGNYQLMYGENISNVNNISGKGYFHIYGDNSSVSISGNINVGYFDLNSVELILGKKSTLNLTQLSAGEDVTLTYYASNAAKMKIKDIYCYTNNDTDEYALTLKLLDADGNAASLSENKSTDIASVSGSYDPDRVVLSDENTGNKDIGLVRSGAKLVTSVSDNTIELTGYYVDGDEVYNYKIGRYDNINNVISDINRLNNRMGNYIISFNSNEPVKLSPAKMPLPTAKKYNELQIVAYNGSVELNITSDIVLTGTLHV